MYFPKPLSFPASYTENPAGIVTRSETEAFGTESLGTHGKCGSDSKTEFTSTQGQKHSCTRVHFSSCLATARHSTFSSLKFYWPICPPPAPPRSPPPCYERKNLKPVLFLLPFAHSHFSLFCHFAFSRVNRKQRR
jgi:hypothetical protein